MHEYNSWDREGQQVYDFVLRHFLATCSKPAVGYKTTVEVDCAGEGFKANGLMITDRGITNMLQANIPAQDYDYNRISTTGTPKKNFHRSGMASSSTVTGLRDSEAVKPQMLSEVDLLTLMEKNGIGTDATQAQHIEKVVGERGYAKKVGENRLVPTNIGEALSPVRFFTARLHVAANQTGEMEKGVDKFTGVP